MMRLAGMVKIARFNWPWYVGAVALNGIAVPFILSPGTDEWGYLAMATLVPTDFWMLSSLVVSHYVYDRSPIVCGAWLNGVANEPGRCVAVLHAGHDEASETAARVLNLCRVTAFDFHDPARNGTRSLDRARAGATKQAIRVAPDRIPVPAACFDVVLLVFAAHEIRRPHERARFFRELARTLTAEGRIVLVEHLRDAWNFLAYGPGAFHFLSRSAWLHAFREAGLTLVTEKHCTPFVRIFEARRSS